MHQPPLSDTLLRAGGLIVISRKRLARLRRERGQAQTALYDDETPRRGGGTSDFDADDRLLGIDLKSDDLVPLSSSMPLAVSHLRRRLDGARLLVMRIWDEVGDIPYMAKVEPRRVPSAATTQSRRARG
jgi:hypothetical protein